MDKNTYRYTLTIEQAVEPTAEALKLALTSDHAVDAGALVQVVPAHRRQFLISISTVGGGRRYEWFDGGDSAMLSPAGVAKELARAHYPGAGCLIVLDSDTKPVERFV